MYLQGLKWMRKMQEWKKRRLLRPDQRVVGAHPSVSLQTFFQGLLGQGTLCQCLGTGSRTELTFFPLYTTKIVLEERLLLQRLFRDWTPAANNIFLSVIAVQKKKKIQKEIWKSAVRSQWGQEMEMDGWTLCDCYRQLWFSKICWAAALLVWEIH